MIAGLFWLVVVILLVAGFVAWHREHEQEKWIKEQMKKLDWWLREGLDK